MPLRSIRILSSNLHPVLPSCLIPSGFSTKAPYAFLFSPTRAACPAHLIPFDLTFGEDYISWSSSLCIFLKPSFFLVLPILEILSICSSVNTIDQFLHPCETRGRTALLHSRYSDSLRAGRFGDRIPVKARFSAPVQTGPGAYPAYRTMSTGSFPGVKRPGRGVDHRPPPSAEVKERVDLYLYPPLGFPGLF